MLRVPLHQLDPELPVPAYARRGDAGADLLARTGAVLPRAGGRALVPTGVAVAIPEGYAGLVVPRSGLAARHGITCLNAPGLVDAGYRGEIRVVLVNHDPDHDYTVSRGDRIAQLVLVGVEQAAFDLVDAVRAGRVGAGLGWIRPHGYMTAALTTGKKGGVMRPLAGMDAAFLSLETPTTPLHVGVAIVMDPPEGTRSLFSPSTRYAQIRRVIEQRVHLVPQMRQRAMRVPFGLHHPVWADDPDFELDDHLSRASLPSPGGRAELDAFVASVMSRRLDPDRPLWEMHIVEGLEGGRTALVAKVHHAILDGVSGASVLAAFLDLTPRSRLVQLPGGWSPPPLPSNAQMLRHAASSLAKQPGEALNTIQAGVGAVADLGLHNRELTGRGEQPPPGFFAAPRTSFNGTVSNRKRYAGLSVPLEDVKLVGRQFGATVNDVLLACVSGGLRRLMEIRREHHEQPLVAMVPVSTRQEDEAAQLGNQISGMLVSLATDVEDPLARLDRISASARLAKEQEKLHRGRLLGDLAQMALPALTSRVARAVAGTRLFDKMRPPFNVTVSSVRVPDVPLFCAGSRVTETYPVGPMAEGVGLNVTVFSYLDRVYFGLLACRRLVPELEELAVHVDDALGELVACALDARGRTA